MHHPDIFDSEELENGKMMRKFPHYPPIQKETFIECPCFTGREKER